VRFTKPFVAALVALTVVAGCGSDHKASPPKKTTTTSSTSTSAAPTTQPAAPVLAPLTGLPTADGAPITRPALAIKIDNSPEGMPQFGVNRADVVIEIEVEGISRLMAVYNSTDADNVGPTRSARYSDPDILAMFGKPLFGWSGANEGVTDRVLKTPWIKNVHWNAAPKLYHRIKGRKVEHTLLTNTPALFGLADPDQAAPNPVFDYLAEGASNPGAVPMPGFDGAIAGTSFRWAWDQASGHWVRWQYNRADNSDEGQLWADNVVVIQTQYGKGPVANSTGMGAAWVFTNGTMTPGLWARPDRTNTYKLTTQDGQPLALSPGRTWVELSRGGPTPMAPETAAGLLAGPR
jgi:hypothetical protein